MNALASWRLCGDGVLTTTLLPCIQQTNQWIRSKDEEAAKRKEEEAKKKKKAKQSKVARLSFAMGGDDDREDAEDADGGDSDGDGAGKKAGKGGGANGNGDNGSLFRKKKPLKNPEAETHFLPDPEREREERELREKLKAEWLAEQERIKGACVSCLRGWGGLLWAS